MHQAPVTTVKLKFCIVNCYPKASCKNFDLSDFGHLHDTAVRFRGITRGVTDRKRASQKLLLPDQTISSCNMIFIICKSWKVTLWLQFEKHISSIGHIQLADTPGRHEPGTGEINYPFLFGFLDRVGYDGCIGCEYIPANKTEEGLGWFEPYK